MTIKADEMRKKASSTIAPIIEAIEKKIIDAAESGKYKIFYDLDTLDVDIESFDIEKYDIYNIIENTFRESGFRVLNSEISWAYRG